MREIEIGDKVEVLKDGIASRGEVGIVVAVQGGLIGVRFDDYRLYRHTFYGLWFYPEDLKVKKTEAIPKKKNNLLV